METIFNDQKQPHPGYDTAKPRALASDKPDRSPIVRLAIPDRAQITANAIFCGKNGAALRKFLLIIPALCKLRPNDQENIIGRQYPTPAAYAASLARNDRFETGLEFAIRQLAAPGSLRCECFAPLS